MKYSVRCADLRMKKWMVAKVVSLRDGANQCRMAPKTVAVCSEEKVSVEAEKMTALQSKAGHQARSQPGIMDPGGTRYRTSSRVGAGRGLRQGSEGGIRSLVSYSILNEA